MPIGFPLGGAITPYSLRGCLLVFYTVYGLSVPQQTPGYRQSLTITRYRWMSIGDQGIFPPIHPLNTLRFFL
ncbi:hypothetical protein [Pseudomonas phage PaeP_Ls]|nr:hypothetical protein [Pseudomonas phage PaeP_Ls]